jgi:hypothetical protein
VFSKLAQYDCAGWAVLEWECALKHPEDGAREGAEFIKRHIICVAEKAFDDSASADGAANRTMLGIFVSNWCVKMAIEASNEAAARRRIRLDAMPVANRRSATSLKCRSCREDCTWRHKRRSGSVFFVHDVRPPQLAASSIFIRPFPPHSLHGAGYIRRPCCAGCLTGGYPVSLQASHFRSVRAVSINRIAADSRPLGAEAIRRISV